MSSPNFTAIRDNARQKLLGQFAHYQQRGESLEFVCHLSQLLADIPVIPGVTSGKDLLRKVKDKKLKDEEDCRADLQPTLDELSSITDTDGQTLAQQIRDKAKCVVFITHTKHIDEDTGGFTTINSKKLGDRKIPAGVELLDLVPEQNYGEQRTARGNGTGFLITNGRGQHFVFTAAHVLVSTFGNCNLEELRFVSSTAFSVRKRALDGLAPEDFSEEVKIKNDLILRPNLNGSNKIRYHWSYNGVDVAIIPVELSEEASVHFMPLNPDNFVTKDFFATVTEGSDADSPETTTSATRQTSAPLEESKTENKKIYALGHGLGLPLKLSPCGEITSKDTGRRTCDAKLDVFAGNSGSPVFTANGHKLAGMLVRGKRNVFYDFSGTKAKLKANRSLSNVEGEEFIPAHVLKKILEEDPKDWSCSLARSTPPAARGGLDKPAAKLKRVDQLIPFTALTKSGKNKWSLRVCLDTSLREVDYLGEATRIDKVFIIDCLLKKRTGGEREFSEKTYPLDDVPNKPEEASIIIRVRDDLNENTYVSVLGFPPEENEAVGKQQENDNFLFAMFLPPLRDKDINKAKSKEDEKREKIHFYCGRIDNIEGKDIFNRSEVLITETSPNTSLDLDLITEEQAGPPYELIKLREQKNINPATVEIATVTFSFDGALIASFPKPTGNDGRVQPSHQFLI